MNSNQMSQTQRELQQLDDESLKLKEMLLEELHKINLLQNENVQQDNSTEVDSELAEAIAIADSSSEIVSVLMNIQEFGMDESTFDINNHIDETFSCYSMDEKYENILNIVSESKKAFDKITKLTPNLKVELVKLKKRDEELKTEIQKLREELATPFNRDEINKIDKEIFVKGSEVRIKKGYIVNATDRINVYQKVKENLGKEIESITSKENQEGT